MTTKFTKKAPRTPREEVVVLDVLESFLGEAAEGLL